MLPPSVMKRPSEPGASKGFLVALFCTGHAACLLSEEPGAKDAQEEISFDPAFAVAPLSRLEISPPTPPEIERARVQSEATRLSLLGVNTRVHVTPTTHGVWTTHGDERVWRLTLRSRGAQFIALVLGDFTIDPGDEFYVESADGGREGPYAADAKNSYGGLFIPQMPGDEVTLVLVQAPGPRRTEHPVDLTVSLVTHGLVDLGGTLAGRPGGARVHGGADDLTNSAHPAKAIGFTCGPGIQCSPYDTSPWNVVRRGEVFIAISSTNFSGASGSFINNTDNDCTPYVLTAEHVMPDQISPANATYFYNYQLPSCAGTAPVTQRRIGSVLRADWGRTVGEVGDDATNGSDFALTELSSAPAGSPQVRFNGWSRSTTASSGGATIHHPNNNPAEMAIDNNPLSASSTWAWLVGNYEDGATFSGSSGAPLFNASARIVGQLNGGVKNLECDPNTTINEKFGRFDKSWTGGGTSATRLKDHLDPLNTNAASIAGRDSQFPQICSGVGGLSLAEFTAKAEDSSDFFRPGTSGVLVVTVAYVGDPDDKVSDVALNLTAAAGAGVKEPHQAVAGSLGAGQQATVEVPVTISDDVKCGEHILVTLDFTGTLGKPPKDAEWDGGWHPQREIVIGEKQVQTVFGEIYLPQKMWDASEPWSIQGDFPAAGGEAALVAVGAGDTSLTSPAIELGTGFTLEFEHRHDSENFFDGGVFEYSIAGSGAWEDGGHLLSVGGYTSTIWGNTASELAGRNAWSGDSGGWRKVVVELNGLAGQTIQLRWRFVSDDQEHQDAIWNLRGLKFLQTTYSCEKG